MIDYRAYLYCAAAIEPFTSAISICCNPPSVFGGACYMGRRSWFTLINKPQMIIHPPAAAAAAIARLVNEALY